MHNYLSLSILSTTFQTFCVAFMKCYYLSEKVSSQETMYNNMNKNHILDLGSQKHLCNFCSTKCLVFKFYQKIYLLK